MLEAHKDLLAQIELAEEAARTLYAKGANVELAIRGLRQAGGLIKDRVAQYIRDAKKPQKGQKPVASDQTPPPLRTDGPTLKEWLAKGYDAKAYPPQGYAVREEAPADQGKQDPPK